jgi:hypothetical protein
MPVRIAAYRDETYRLDESRRLVQTATCETNRLVLMVRRWGL